MIWDVVYVNIVFLLRVGSESIDKKKQYRR